MGKTPKNGSKNTAKFPRKNSAWIAKVMPGEVAFEKVVEYIPELYDMLNVFKYLFSSVPVK